MSILYCVRCGEQQLEQLAGDDDGDVFGCRFCRALVSLTIFETQYHFLPDPGDTPIFQACECDFCEAQKLIDKGVSL